MCLPTHPRNSKALPPALLSSPPIQSFLSSGNSQMKTWLSIPWNGWHRSQRSPLHKLVGTTSSISAACASTKPCTHGSSVSLWHSPVLICLWLTRAADHSASVGQGDVLEGLSPLSQPGLWCQAHFGLSRVLSHLFQAPLEAPGASVRAQAADSPSVPHLSWLKQQKNKSPSAWVSEEVMFSSSLLPSRAEVMSCRLGGSWEQKPGLWGGLVVSGHLGGSCSHWTPISWFFCVYFFPSICVEKYLTFSLWSRHLAWVTHLGCWEYALCCRTGTGEHLLSLGRMILQAPATLASSC